LGGDIAFSLATAVSTRSRMRSKILLASGRWPVRKDRRSAALKASMSARMSSSALVSTCAGSVRNARSGRRSASVERAPLLPSGWNPGASVVMTGMLPPVAVGPYAPRVVPPLTLPGVSRG
jgi:hypothetical protein